MKKEIRVRCWIDIDGEKFFGPGRVELLELISETGSTARQKRLRTCFIGNGLDAVYSDHVLYAN